MRQRLVYVAGASDELQRARAAMDAVEAEGWSVACDWVTQVLELGLANPYDATEEFRLKLAWRALDAVRQSDAVWFLVPQVGPGRGAYAELGCAAVLSIPIVVSGPDAKQSIFTACGELAETDAAALELLRGWL